MSEASQLLMFLCAGSVLQLAGWIIWKVSGRWPDEARNRDADAIRFLMRMGAVVVVVGGLVCWGALGFFAGLLWIAILWSTFAAQSRAGELTALWTLAIASRSGRPLGREMWHQMECLQGPARRRLKRLALLLGDGEPLDQALQRCRILPRSCSMELQAALDAGALSEALQQAAARETQRFSQGPQLTESFSISYIAVIVDVMLLIVGFLMYWIIPKFKKIFYDFGTELPTLTIWLIGISDSLAKYGFPFLIMLLPLSAFAVWCDTHARYYGWRSVFERCIGTWWPRFRIPDIWRGLAWGIRQERPLAETFAAMTLGQTSAPLRRQLRQVAEQMRQGISPWETLAERQWITRTEAEALTRAESVGNLPWVLETLAEAEEQRWERRFQYAIQIVRPMLIVAIGLVVALIATAFFLPLVKLVNDLS